MKRRLFMLSLISLGITPAAAFAISVTTLPDRLLFRIMRHGSDIGRHSIVFERNSDRLMAHIEASMHIGFGPITLYRYHHQAVETWRGDEFISLDSVTDKNGTPLKVKARRTNDAVSISTGRVADFLLPPDSIPFTHWNKLVTQRPLFDPQDGVAAPEHVSAPSETFTTSPDGKAIPTTQFDFTGRATITDWYDQSRQWTALRAVAPDGSIVSYERLPI